jgi:hypothetical protein
MKSSQYVKTQRPTGFSNGTANFLIALLYPTLILLWGSWWTSNNGTTKETIAAPASTPPERQSVISKNPEPPSPVTEKHVSDTVPDTTGGTWEACRSEDDQSAQAPQPGEMWWPVVGPPSALDDARSHCRADAFINQTGNMQIASFRDRATAEEFASTLTTDGSHPYRFWVGEPSYR